MDSYGKRRAKDYYLAGVSIKGPQSLSQRSTGKEESNRDSQLDRNTMQETRRVKQKVTITAGVLRPRYLRTYARPAPVNRAKEQDSGWTVTSGLTREIAFRSWEH